MKVLERPKLPTPKEWRAEIKCSFCSAKLEIEYGDVHSEIVDKDRLMSSWKETRYYVRCPCCLEKNTVKVPKIANWTPAGEE